MSKKQQAISRRSLLTGGAAAAVSLPLALKLGGCDELIGDGTPTSSADGTPTPVSVCPPEPLTTEEQARLLLQPEVWTPNASGDLTNASGQPVDMTFGITTDQETSRNWTMKLPINPNMSAPDWAAYNDPSTWVDHTMYVPGYTGENNIGSGFGPTMRVRAGDRFKINLVNNLQPWLVSDPVPRGCADQNDCDNVGVLTQMDQAARGHNFPHEQHVTNMHTHGLQISPVCPSDYIYNLVDPGTSFPYDYGRIAFADPAADMWEQTAGTYWYHPHNHGAVSYQMYGSGIGFLIVEGAIDSYLAEPVTAGGLALDPANDIVVGLSNLLLPYTVSDPSNAKLPPVNINALNQRSVQQYPIGAGGSYDANGTQSMPVTLINGQYQPIIHMAKNTLYRLRLLNGRVEDSVNFKLYKQSDWDPTTNSVPRGTDSLPWLNQISFDGLTLGAPALGEDGVGLAPGNRSDVLVQPDTCGWFAILDTAVQPPPFSMSAQNVNIQTLLGWIYVEDSDATPVTLPTSWDKSNAHYPVVEPRLRDTLLLSNQVPQQLIFDILTNSAPNPGCAGTTCPEDASSGSPPSPQMEEYFLMWNPNNGQVNLPPTVDDVSNATFSSSRVDYCQVINSTVEFTLFNYSQMMHPFHIHVNPIYVERIFHTKAQRGQGAWSSLLRWQDTIAVPPARVDPQGNLIIDPVTGLPTPGIVTFRTRFLNFTGDFVAHCHKVNHEDLGMMVNIRVQPQNGSDPTCVANEPDSANPAIPYQTGSAPQCPAQD